jgi:hypothetical protein
MVNCESNDSLLTVYASKEKNDDILTIILINKEKEKSKKVTLDVQDFIFKSKANMFILDQSVKKIQTREYNVDQKNYEIEIESYSAIVIELENINYTYAPINYALYGKASASSYSLTGPNFSPKSANDGLKYTRWASAAWVSKDGTDQHWFQLDLGKPQTFNTIKIFWDYGYGIKYDILISIDGEKWDKILSNEEGKGGVEEYKFKTINSRFTKLDLKKGKKAISTYNIKEFEVYNK